MFVVYCPTCDRRSVIGVGAIDSVDNLTPGMISVSGRCPEGHYAVLLTGKSFTPHERAECVREIRQVLNRRRRRTRLGAWFARQRELHDRLFRY
ncbi:hypothetical protein [Amycolatopsis azurea]|uniref:Uncharacterized protein n=1 Tax=Amycolatopsis azurea DSM 43854 TaxID=1238180 RepID=M2Q5C2_9PSEU|nr:hypothetical protein [Amycolatopsis azurea]EMD27180.1 hypothetical protein C791_2458 [Amycolatopsis azurea DSM 43854]OOC03915.1 hypothetical protein B0293_24835 [Amycolatopsis azurea DSM 43854]